jgi:hypothetical protein
VRHETADEVHVTRQSVELGDDDRARLPVAASLGEGGGELRAAIEGVRTFARLDLGELPKDPEPLGLGEPGDGGALGVKAETRPALLASADPVVGDERLDIYTRGKMMGGVTKH